VELALARLRPDGTIPAGAALRAVVARGASTRSLVLVTAALDPELPAAVRDARARAVNVALVLAGPAAALAGDCRRAGASVRAVGAIGELERALGVGSAQRVGV
jgi:hypothetical protein